MSASTDLVYGLFRPDCYAKYFHAHDFFDVACLKFLVSKVLSYGVIFGAVVIKLPQVANIVRAGSTKGLSPTTYVLENVGYMLSVAYNMRHAYAFSTYGESVFLLLQGLVLMALFAQYNKGLTTAMVGAAAGIASLAYYLWFLAPLSQFALFQVCAIVILAASRIPQIWSNFSNGSTGVLSFITVLGNFAGTSARIFTTVQEVNDPMVLLSSVSSWVLNAIIFAQMLIYWNSDSKGASKKQQKKKNKAQKDE